MRYARDIIQHLVDTKGYKDYLEIGIDTGFTFGHITVEGLKHGVDPSPKQDSGTTHEITSGAFFAQNENLYDLIFIDGLHQADQAYQDALNSLNCLNIGGTVVMHDCNPPYEECQFPKYPGDNTEWCGDVWKAWVKLRTLGGLRMAVLDMDYGVGIIQPDPSCHPISIVRELNYSDLENNRMLLLNLIDPAVMDDVFSPGAPD